MATWDKDGFSMGMYTEGCPASEDGCFSPLQWEASATIKRGLSTRIWITPGQAAHNKHRLKPAGFQNILLQPQTSTTHTEPLGDRSCSSAKRKMNLIYTAVL